MADDRPRISIPDDKTLPTPDPSVVQVIRSYGPGHFLIGERDWREPVLVTPGATLPLGVTRIEDLTADAVAVLKTLATPTELLVLGCGARAAFVPPDRRAAFKAAGLGLEVVDTGSACRIYNVLVAEGRRVAAALLPL
ncbi:MAG: Mth938-like domain-containing protein [Proteobacteria bacterium]|nr:Mth938-like domain-containing protein [Pseudomonadota bacterium]